MAIRLFLLIASLAGIIGLVRLSSDNRQLSVEIDQLEAELGRMSIDDADRVYLVEIDSPDVPPEVAAHLEFVWQFRCYLPPGYDFTLFSGSGRVAKEGLYQNGGFGSNGGSPQPEAIHKLMTVSFQRKGDQWEVFHSFGGSSVTSSWFSINQDRLSDALVVQKLVNSEQGPRSFEQGTILPLLKIFDSTSAKDDKVAGKTLTTYEGGFMVLCPKSRESEFIQLRKGETPLDFDPRWIATEVGDE